MTQEEYIKTHPEQFKDDIDKWLFTEFGIIGGCCSAEKSHEYHIARMVAERYEQNRLAHCDELTPEQAQVESDFVVQHLKSNKRTPTFIDAIKYGMQLKEDEWMEYAIERSVKIDAGGYPYIEGDLELYDYDKDVPLAKEGNKVKVIIIKED